MENISMTEQIAILKALGDLNRLSIVEMLSSGELCACKILERFNITQPTLSHHMKVLIECGLVNGRKKGVWTHYSINKDVLEKFIGFFTGISEGLKDGEQKKDFSCEE